MMRRKLYIHIGAPRTATTTVQRFLQWNKDVLAQKGYWLVNEKGRHAHVIEKLSYEELSVAQAVSWINRQIDACPHAIHSVILSDEDICRNFDLGFLQPFQDYFDVKLIYTVRRQDLWLESWYFQNIKWQWDPYFRNLTFAEFMAKSYQFHWIEYDQCLQRIEELFGPECLFVGLYERHDQAGTPIENFLGYLGIDSVDEFSTTDLVSNSSFAPEVAEFVRHLQIGFVEVPYRDGLIGILNEIDREFRATRYVSGNLLLPYEERLKIMAHYAPGNQWVAERYFGRERLFLEDLPDADAPLATMKLPDDPEMLMDGLVVPFFRKLIDKYGKS